MAATTIRVDPEGTRAHADAVEKLATGLAEVLEAASWLAHADDGYGLLVRPYASSILGPKHDTIVDGLRTSEQALSAMPGKLRQAADTFEDVDEARKGELDVERERLDESGCR
ncbi:type VII secretion target [Nocardia higoensis]|uniref:type VII secretion target n=1 Tax=Nocardia higoensis TaxID=228599 RepID=UPI0002F7D0AE|nr:type VII secretion target [Nocardia higoensis]